MDIFSPIQNLADWFAFSVFRLPAESILGEAVSFFIFDVIKIFFLLCVIIFIFAIIRSFLPQDKIKKILSQRFTILGNILASLIGIVTPFCSCSAVPLFIGFVEAGVPLGVTFSYLIAAPMINEVAVVLLLGLFGWKIAGIYILSGLLIAILAGFILGRLGLEGYIEDYASRSKIKSKKSSKSDSWRLRAIFAAEETSRIVQHIFPWVILGVALGAFIHGFAPQDLLTRFAGPNTWYGVPLAVLIGVPLYSNAAGMIPIVSSLIEKGLPLGTALAFMMAVTALSLPEMIILRRVMKMRLLIIFVSIVTIGILFTGYLFNWLM